MLTAPNGQGKGKNNRRSSPCGATAAQAFDDSLRKLLSTAHIGVDEAGRGCLAGPVVAGAALFPQDFSFADFLPGLDDSKKLSPAKRDALAPLVRRHALAWGIGVSWQEEIDAANILNATFRAMSRAVYALAARRAGAAGAEGAFSLPHLIIDGNHTIPEAQWDLSTGYVCPGFATGALEAWAAAADSSEVALAGGSPTTSGIFGVGDSLGDFCSLRLPSQHFLIQGDSRCPSIAAASILAKTARDAIMAALDPLFPGYAFAEHKGYGTATHLAALETNGPCPLHRMTFRKVRPEERQLSLI